jgi:ribosomal protein L37AE/L43A
MPLTEQRDSPTCEVCGKQTPRRSMVLQICKDCIEVSEALHTHIESRNYFRSMPKLLRLA